MTSIAHLKEKAIRNHPMLNVWVDRLYEHSANGGDPFDFLKGRKFSEIRLDMRNQLIRSSAKLIPDDLVANRARDPNGCMISARAGQWLKEFNQFRKNAFIVWEQKGFPNGADHRFIIFYTLQMCWRNKLPKTSKQIRNIIEKDYQEANIQPTEFC